MGKASHGGSREPSGGTSRRQFLKHAAVGAAGAWAASRGVARGQEGSGEGAGRSTQETTALEPLRVAVIGTGGMGSGHLRALLGHRREGREKLEVVALCDVCQPRLDDALKICAEDQPGVTVRSYTDHRALLREESGIQAVWIASPEHWHSRMAIDAIEAGKDVYLEKPMTLDLEQAMDLWRAERGSDRIVVVGTQYTTQGKYHEARRLIQEGAIGHPVTSQTSYCRNSLEGEWLYSIDERVKPGETLDWEAWLGALGPMPFDTRVYHRWRRYRRFSTGIVGDLLVHQMTPLLMALDVGWPVRVTATGGHYVDKAMENHDQVNLTVQFEKEHTMVVAGSTCNEYGLETMIRGHKGNLMLNSNRCELWPERVFAEEVEKQEFQYPTEEPQQQLQLAFLNAVRTRERPLSTVELGTQVMVIVDLATRSMWEGGAFGYSPSSMTSFRI